MASNDIILYHYDFSPYATRVRWYLALRGIPYTQCLQPYMMPRPDIASLGIAYRRIPVLAIGRDVYLDSQIQFAKLEKLSAPNPPLCAGDDAQQYLLRRLFSIYITDAGVFRWLAVLLITSDEPMAKDPAFQQDREDYCGKMPEDVAAARAEAYRELAAMFRLLETTLLADGREWLLKTTGPTLADIEAIWPLFFVSGMKSVMPEDSFSPKVYPKVYAWIDRMNAATEAAEKKHGDITKIAGPEALQAITGASYHEQEQGGVDESDFDVVAQKLRKGDTISVGPTDFGSSRRDSGKLLSINADEVVFEVATETGATVRVHAPRHGYQIKKESA